MKRLVSFTDTDSKPVLVNADCVELVRGYPDNTVMTVRVTPNDYFMVYVKESVAEVRRRLQPAEPSSVTPTDQLLARARQLDGLLNSQGVQEALEAISKGSASDEGIREARGVLLDSGVLGLLRHTQDSAEEQAVTIALIQAVTTWVGELDKRDLSVGAVHAELKKLLNTKVFRTLYVL